ncbi:MAG: N-acetyltransferase [Candidatus Woesearchaeota archaeon]|nr:MAG: N-acetyltransferase [Candidatus Woesearchaeota archaeon]
MKVIHDYDNKRFYCVIDGKECVVQYHLDGDVIDFYHTYVPISLRGKGIARQLYDYIYSWLEENKRKGLKLIVKTSCSYAYKYFNELKDLNNSVS